MSKRYKENAINVIANNIDKFDNASELIDKLASSVENQANNIIKLIDAYDNLNKKLNIINVEEFDQKVKVTEDKIDFLSLSFKSIEDKLEYSLNSIDNRLHTSINEKIDQLNKNVKDVYKSTKDLNSKIDSLDVILDDMKNFEKTINSLNTKINKMINPYSKDGVALTTLNNLQDDIKSFKNIHSDFLNKYKTLTKRISDVLKAIEEDSNDFFNNSFNFYKDISETIDKKLTTQEE